MTMVSLGCDRGNYLSTQQLFLHCSPMLMLGLFNHYWGIWERDKLGKPKFTSNIFLKRLKGGKV